MSLGKAGRTDAYPGMPFNQQMSFPRELILRSTAEGPRLVRQPVGEIAQLTPHARPGPGPCAGGTRVPPGSHRACSISSAISNCSRPGAFRSAAVMPH